MKRCKLCGRETTGSVGAAGLVWPFLCQQCKDAEDQAYSRSVAAVAVAVDHALPNQRRPEMSGIGSISAYDSWKLSSPPDDDEWDDEEDEILDEILGEDDDEEWEDDE